MVGKTGLWRALALGAAVAAASGFVAAAAPVKPPARQPPKPCLEASEACVQWVALGKSGARSMVYSTYPLSAPNAHVRRALIMVHGTLRNADHYFTTATGAAFLAKALDDTIVIAPALRSADGGCKDALAPHEVSWSCGGDSWRSGGKAASDPALTSFDFVDEILRRLADKKVFPNLKVIVVAGHSAGGQFVSRYEMANRVHETLGTPVVYVVANPSSYAWPDATRPLPVDDAAPANAVRGWESEEVHTHFSYGPFAAADKAPKYDQWPYGFAERSGYAAQESDAQLRGQLAGRPATYLFSQVDTLPLGGFDGSPSAMAQGATRRARGEAFVKYLNEHFGGHAKSQIVPECGHNDRCVFTTDDVLKVIFPPV
ncbi:alpha/beta hydrolase [Phenylobacterium sp.]|uniref:alpha/beta fold hydrolase n=1 Tax=Phenylobacterium sp. TaxID=1871053 RepID=UPI0012037F69|nr:alpha/beta hydrolase [Phenylobacterium sp.]THD63013.1 MAG: alpha/beta hydrolase [Phenylobacterium sp.]